MKINIHSIRDAGTDIQLSPTDEWVKTLLRQSFPAEQPKEETVSGKVHIDRFNDDLDLKGSISVHLTPICARCGERFDYMLEMPLLMHLVPTQGENEEDEDINFAYHNGVDIDLVELLSEQLVLALPFDFFCKPDCKGLCPQCGANFNISSCNCSKPIDPRLAVLQNIKGKN